jgi:hypothetical protein
MSIKTSKRIALGVIAGLVFAPFAAIAPASATELATDIDLITVATSKPSGRTGVEVVLNNTITFNATAVAGDVPVIASTLISKPATSTATVTLAFGSAGTSALVSGDITPIAPGTTTAAATADIVPANGEYEADETVVLTSTFTPDVVGTYELLTWYDLNDNGLLNTGETQGTLTITVVDGANPVSAALSQYNSRAQTGATGNGSLVRVTITNSAGAAASLGTFETITASVGSGVVYKVNGGTTDAASVTLGRADFDRQGRAWLNLTSSADGVQVLSVKGNTGAPLSGISLSATTTFVAAAGDIATLVTVGNTTGVAVTTANVYNTTAGAWTVDPLKTTSVAFASTATAAAVVPIIVTDVSGRLTGLANAAYTTSATATADGELTFTAPAFTPTAATNNYTVKFGTDNLNTITVTATAGAPAAAADVTRDQASTLRVAPGAAVTVSAVWKDKFGIAVPNQVVSVAVTNRNAHIATQNSVTDASGRVNLTYTDSPLAGVTATSDTVTFDGPTGADVTFTINWAAVVVGTVKIDTPDTTAGVANTVKATPSPISAGAGGAEDGAVSISATVTDANNAVYAGVPVTFSVTGTTAAILSTKVIAYTDATGKATSSVYAWATGTYTVTATAGGIASTGTIAFASTTADNARVVTATVAGDVVTGKVVDRFGNPVSGVTLYATTTSPANIGGIFTKDVVTGNDGTASWVISGSGAVAVSAVNPASPAGTTFGQTCAAATKVSCATTAVALVAATTGTATTAETNVGNSFAPAGVASATATVAAPVVVVPPVVYDKPTLSFVKNAGRIILSGTAVDGEGDIIIYVKKVGTTAWKERAKTLEVAAPGDFNGSILAPKSNVLIRVKQEGTGLFSNQIIVVK